MYLKLNKVLYDYCLILGDFDNVSLDINDIDQKLSNGSYNNIKKVIQHLEETLKTQFLYIPGNHDSYELF